MPRQKDFFQKLVWSFGRMQLNDLVFDIADDGTKEEAGASGFLLRKPKRMIKQYEKFWQSHPDFEPRNILELGTHQGASVVFWNECLRPDRFVAIDILGPEHGVLLDHYVMSRNLQEQIKTHWKTSQTDAPCLRQIVATDFTGPVDLIIDDASHVYEHTKVSFETLFPLLQPGGQYIIEDWSWACWSKLPEEFNPGDPTWRPGQAHADMGLPRLIVEIMMTAGKMESYMTTYDEDYFIELKPLIATVTVYPDFVVVERGDAEVATSRPFKLEELLLPQAK